MSVRQKRRLAGDNASRRWKLMLQINAMAALWQIGDSRRLSSRYG